MVLPQWGLTSKLQRLFFYETLVLNSADSFQNPPTAQYPNRSETSLGFSGWSITTASKLYEWKEINR